MRIFKSLDLVPERVHLRKAVALDIVNVLIFVNSLSVDEKRLEKLTGGEVVNILALPCVVGIEDLVVPAVVYRKVSKASLRRGL